MYQFRPPNKKRTVAISIISITAMLASHNLWAIGVGIPLVAIWFVWWWWNFWDKAS